MPLIEMFQTQATVCVDLCLLSLWGCCIYYLLSIRRSINQI